MIANAACPAPGSYRCRWSISTREGGQPIFSTQIADSSNRTSEFIRPSTIVIATDLTDLDDLLPHALSQAQGIGSAIVLVHVLPSLEDASLRNEPSSKSNDDELEIKSILSRFAGELQSRRISCSVIVKRGIPGDAVIQEVHKSQATRLMIGAHRHGHAGQTLIGSVANALILQSNVPTFVVPGKGSDPVHAVPHAILHPLSLSQSSRATVPFALELASAYGAELTLLHVIDEAVMAGSYVKEIFAQANRQMSAFVEPANCSTTVRNVVTTGNTVPEIVRVASEIQSDWIVVGIEHDFPWWSMRNNIAYQVISESRVPVLLVRKRMLLNGGPA